MRPPAQRTQGGPAAGIPRHGRAPGDGGQKESPAEAGQLMMNNAYTTAAGEGGLGGANARSVETAAGASALRSS